MLPEIGELLQREESLQIYSLTEDVDSGHTSVADSPTSPSMLQSAVGSKDSTGSWVQVLMSAEKASVTNSDEYCTLSHTLREHAVNTH